LKKGLIIGKFMPLHKGHVGLINFACKNCDELTVLAGVLPGEPIEGHLRYKWLWETFRDNRKIKIDFTDDILPAAAESSRSVSKVWAEYPSKKYPGVRIIFSSEPYGEYLAEYMQIEHKYYDPERIETPVSATMIRENPFLYWEYIPEAVKSYFRKKVCIYGTESVGKSTLTENLARHYKTNFVPEMAREYLNDHKVVYEDIPVIAEIHANAILDNENKSERIMFVDTDIITTQIFSKFYFDKVPDFPPWVWNANKFDLYLFLETDTPWVDDPQRDTKDCRKEHRIWFQKELDDRNIPFTLISGSWDERFKKSCKTIENKWKFPENF